MKVRNHKLLRNDGKTVPFDNTPNKSPGTITPTHLVMHYTAGGTLDGAVNWFNNSQAKASAQLVIGHDGAIVQMGAFNQKLWHAGKSRLGGLTGFNNFSIGIEVVNWGKLSGGPGNWRSWTGTLIPDNRVLIAKHRLDSTSAGWEIFDEIQYEKSVQAAIAICDAYNIPEINLVGHDDISGYRGKRDTGPIFDMDRFKGRVFGRQNDNNASGGDFMVSSATGLNLREGPGLQYSAIKLLPNNTLVNFIETDGNWWLVAEIDSNGNENNSGWVHSRWLVET